MQPDEIGGSAVGFTESERVLVRLCRSSFLTPWSFPNPFIDEGRCSGKGQGKELADALVVFGDEVLLFSDKNPIYPLHSAPDVAWCRWFRKAIWKSALQLKGASLALDRSEGRVFADSFCTRKIAAQMPPSSRRRVHLIAVTRGSVEACRTFFNSIRGTYIINSGVCGLEQHLQTPFTVGHLFDEGPFVHVFDEFSLDFVLTHFDTTLDFVKYLSDRADLFANRSLKFIAEGEEELAAGYLLNHAYGRSGFLPISPDEKPPDSVLFAGGLYEELVQKPEYIAKQKQDQQSKAFDLLIERFSENGNPVQICGAKNSGIASVEESLRVLASEDRFRRRQIFVALAGLIESAASGEVGSRMRVVYSEQAQDRAYVIGVAARFEGESDAAFRERRQRMLLDYCECVQLRFPKARTVVGICVDRPGNPGPKYEDLVVYKPPPLTPDTWLELELYRKSLGILSERSEYQAITEYEYPSPAAR